jgi:hypothetical protein|tara:strand:+ start:289 stop:636 length:348 start_codon:yes stop_codon:yes gene_type:complete
MNSDELYTKFLGYLAIAMLVCAPIGGIWFLYECFYTAFIEGDSVMRFYFWIIFIFFGCLGLIGFVLWLRNKKIISAKVEDKLTTAFILPFIILLVLGAILQALGILNKISHFLFY